MCKQFPLRYLYMCNVFVNLKQIQQQFYITFQLLSA